MNTSQLSGRSIVIGASDLWTVPITGTVHSIDQDRLVASVDFGDGLVLSGVSFSHAVVSVRYQSQSLLDLFRGLEVVCAVTLIPHGRFIYERPFDLSWWRGGWAGIAGVKFG
jgi:hypothetical protein